MALLGLEPRSYNVKLYGLPIMSQKALIGSTMNLWQSEFGYWKIRINLSFKVGPQFMYREDWAINDAPSNCFEQFLLHWTNEPCTALLGNLSPCKIKSIRSCSEY